MQSIIVRYRGATNTRGSRLLAKNSAGGTSVSIPWDSGLSDEENYSVAAVALCAKLGWHGSLASGSLEDGDRVFIFVKRGAGDIEV